MNEETKEILWELFKIGTVGTLVSLPAGWWAMKRWPDAPWKTAAVLTAIGFLTKEVMLSHAEPLPAEQMAGNPGPPWYDAPYFGRYAKWNVKFPTPRITSGYHPVVDY